MESLVEYDPANLARWPLLDYIPLLVLPRKVYSYEINISERIVLPRKKKHCYPLD